MSEHDEPAVDDAFLDELAREYGDDVRLGLVATFVDGIDACMPRIEASANAVDRRRLAQLGHLVRGTAANFRARPLAALGAQIERAAPSCSRSDACGAASRIRAEIERVRASLAARALLRGATFAGGPTTRTT